MHSRARVYAGYARRGEGGGPLPWNGRPEQHEGLKAALVELAGRGVSDEILARSVNESEVRARYPETRKSSIHRSTLSRWRTDREALADARFHHKMLVYNFLEESETYATDFIRRARGMESFFDQCAGFFGIKQAATAHLAQALSGKFQVYRYSQTIPHSLVIGSFDIDRREDGSISVIECQRYDGTLNPALPPMRDDFDGFGFQRNNMIYLLMRHSSAGTPQFYIFEDFHNDPDGIPFLKGYLLKGSRDGSCFRSPVFVRRIAATETPVLNIVPCAHQSVRGIIDILSEIELAMWHGQGPQRP